jgi:hypothetical protein
MNKQRSLELQIQGAVDTNIVEFSLASSAPYLRTEDDYTYYEVLTISEEAISFERLVDEKAPFLFEHDTTKQIGVIERAFIADNKLQVVVRFSENEFAQEVLRDVKAGIRRNVSLGYIINDYDIVKNQGDFDTMIVTRWMPYEGSSVSVPADHTVGFKRNLNIEEGEKNMTEDVNKIVDPESVVNEEVQEEIVEEVQETVAETEAVEEVVDTEEKTVETEIVETDEGQKNLDEEVIDETEEIRAAGELAGEEELAEQAIEQKKSLTEFKTMVKEKRNFKNKKNTLKDNKKMEKFSISKAIRNACSQYKADISEEYETKVTQENKRSMNLSEEYDVVVTNKQLRALAPTAGNGKELITGDYLPQEFTPALRPELTLEATGYHVIPVTGPSVSFATVTKGATAAMYDLDGTLADTDLTFATKELKPRKARSLCTRSLQFTLTSSSRSRCYCRS